MQEAAEASAMALCAAEETAEQQASVRSAIIAADSAQRVRHALQLAASRHTLAMDTLRIAVCEFTLEHRSKGVTPERVLIILKGIIEDRATPYILPHQSDLSGDRLRENISTWCIKSYFSTEAACI